MPTFNDLTSLFAYVEKVKKNAMETEVANQVKETLSENVITEVYDQYTPSRYKRTGGLYQEGNMESKMIDEDTLSVRSTRQEGSRDIVQIIESGKGYYSRSLDEEIGPRPFHEKTAQELREKDLVERALIKGMKKQGIDVR